MLITFSQPELHKAIISYLKTQFNIPIEACSDIQMKASRGEEGFQATIEVTEPALNAGIPSGPLIRHLAPVETTKTVLAVTASPAQPVAEPVVTEETPKAEASKNLFSGLRGRLSDPKEAEVAVDPK